MQVEIDPANVDEEVVSEVLVVLTDAMLEAEVDPNVEEMVVALSEMIRALLEHAMGVGEAIH